MRTRAPAFCYETWYAARLKHCAYVGGKERPEHYVWRTMLVRCRDKHRGYENVTVCKAWHEYVNFIADMGSRPTPQHQLERIDNCGHYEPGNCKWATRSEQQKNKSSTRRWVSGSVVGTLFEWAAMLGISPQLAHYRMKKNGTFVKGRTFCELQKPE